MNNGPYVWNHSNELCQQPLWFGETQERKVANVYYTCDGPESGIQTHVTIFVDILAKCTNTK
jgi:hypothetical protein